MEGKPAKEAEMEPQYQAHCLVWWIIDVYLVGKCTKRR